MKLAILQSLGQALVKNAAKCLMKCLPFGELLYDIATDWHRIWKEKCNTAQRRAELEMVAQADPATARQLAQQAAKQVAPPEIQQAVAEYLERVPGVVRRSLSRPEDPSGRTAAGVPLDTPENLVPFLPPRPPRFRAGDRPKGGEGWLLQELLGAGGFGEVWRARHDDGHEAALKFSLNPDAIAALQNDKELLLRVQKAHPRSRGFVRLLSHHLEAETPFLVFEYIPGGELTRLIGCWHQSRRFAPRLVRETVRLMRHLASILGLAHGLDDPVVHRDVKPSNILLMPTRPNFVRPCLADLGIGGIATQPDFRLMSKKETTTTAMRGALSKLYASPQQFDRGVPAPTDDVFALGVIGYQTLMGDTTIRPEAGMRKQLTERNVPAAVIDMLTECLSDDAEDRAANGRVLAENLEVLLAQLPDFARNPS